METARLRAFVETVEKGSVKAAADSLGYTPSAISQLITALEKGSHFSPVHRRA